MSAITDIKVELGFIDILDAGLTTDNGGAITTQATPTFDAGIGDAALWAFDTADDGNWHGVATNNGDTSPATQVDMGFAPVAATYEYLMIELREYTDNTGAAADRWSAVRYSRFDAAGLRTYISDWQGGGLAAAANAGPNATILLTPWIYARARSATSVNLDIDYLGVWQRRSI